MTAHARLVGAHSRSVARSVSFERLPTNTTANTHPVHRWFNFIAGFSPEFVEACLALHDDANTRPLHVLDPFVGCGTTSVTASRLGHAATGYDPHPLFSVISEAKANSAQYWPALGRIEALIRQGLARPGRADRDLSIPAVTFLAKMFRPETLAALLGARRALASGALSDNPLAILIVSRMLDYCCLAATDGIYKAPTTTKNALAPEAAVNRVVAMLRADGAKATAPQIKSRTLRTSSETMPEILNQSVDLVITSPPYLNNFDFAEMTRMYLYFWGMAGSWGEISEKVRSRLIVNTTTALKGHKEMQDRYRSSLPSCLAEELDHSVTRLAGQRAVRAGKKDYDYLVYPYLSQMLSVLKECKRVLKRGAPLHIIVSDAALYGVHLPAPQWLAKMMEAIGFLDVECHMIRARGHRWVLKKRDGAQSLGEYYLFGRSA